MARLTITPWRAHADLLQVRQHLYGLDGGESNSQRQAVDRVMAWKLRGNLPHAVESTALLIDAVLHHDTTVNTTFSIRAVYSAAFCRFVTGFCDIGRHRERSLEPSSMLEIAKQIGMPGEFVALRHEATHEELPGLQRLVNATRKALEWLWAVYWSRLEMAELQQMEPLELKSQVSRVLRSYRRTKLERLRKDEQSDRDDFLLETRICEDLQALHHNRRVPEDQVLELMVVERLLFPVGVESSLDGAFLLWDDLIFRLDDYSDNFLSQLCRAMVQSLAAPTSRHAQVDFEKRSLLDWLLHLVEQTHLVGDQNDLASWVAKHCCLYPGRGTQELGKALLNVGNEAFRDDWSDLLQASWLSEGHQVDDSRRNQAKEDEEGGEGDPSAAASDKGTCSWTRAILPPDIPVGSVK